jgi:hypothetical protein
MTYAVLSAIPAIVWALVVLQRSGFDLNALNPFLWKRRRDWQAKRAARPIFALEEPIDVACVLLVAVAREGSELITEDRERLVGIFTQELKLDERKAREELKLAEYMLREGPSIVGEVGKIVAPCRGKFNQTQVDSLKSLLPTVTGSSRPLTPRQSAIVAEFDAAFRRDSRGKWGEG